MEPTLTELLGTEFLHCPGCMRGCYIPRLLSCLHSFCDNCVRSGITKLPDNINSAITTTTTTVKNASHCNDFPDLSSNGKESQTKGNANTEDEISDGNDSFTKYIVCPLCKANTKLPEKNGIDGLPTNVFLNNLLQIKSYKLEEGKKCDYCSYDGKERDAGELCVECQDVMCSDCSAAHRRTKVTREHRVVPFTEIAKHSYDHDLRAAQQIKCPEHNGKEVVSFCEQCKVTICSECKNKKHYQHSYWDFQSVLKTHHSKTKQFLATIDSKLPSIEAWLKFMQCYTEDLKTAKSERLRDVDRHSRNLHRIIEEYKIIQMNKISEISEHEQEKTVSKMQSLMRAKQYLKHDSELLKYLLEFGKPDEILSMQSQICERTRQLANQQLGSVSSKLNVQFQPTSLNGDVLEKVFGKLSLYYLPLSQEESLSLGGNSISASLMLPNVFPSSEIVLTFDADCGTDDKDVWPSGACVTPEGDYIVVDRDNRRVKIFDKNGSIKSNFGGIKQNELGCPFDVAVLQDGNLAVTDYESENVKVFKMSGEFVRDIRGHFKYPRGIAVNSKGHLVVVDCHFRRVTVHDPDSGKVLKTIEGKDENECDYFTDPYYVAVTADDKIVVTDWAAPNIRIFSAEGCELNSYGSYGTRQNQVLHPYGVCVDKYGYIFVADNANHRVHLLLPDGNFCRHLLNKMDTLWHPIAMTTDNSGHLILTEALGKVKIFKYI